jgi:membrane associated rhomboid family serine protease
MIPLGNASRHTLHFPFVTIAIILANLGVFLQELARGNAFVLRWSVVPAHIVAGQDLITILTAMFLHASWIHILGNMLFLWVFGPQIEDVMGPLRYLVFYILAGITAMVAQVLAAPASMIPNLGASGAIAGVMGAFLVTYPRDRIRTLLFLGIFIDIAFLPAVLLVGIWFALQLFSEVGAFTQAQLGGVAYMAHIGGFLFGLLLNRLFETRKGRMQQARRQAANRLLP